MKFNKNIILFVAVMLFILSGFTLRYFQDLKYQVLSFLVQNEDAAEDVSSLLDRIDNMSTDYLRYHDEMMHLDSLKQRLTNNRIIVKDDDTVVRTDSDSLVLLQSAPFSETEVDGIVDNITRLQKHAKANNAEFLYIAAPSKSVTLDLPENVTDYGKDNFSTFLNGLEKNNVPTLNLCRVLEEENRLDSSLFFKTDHHWLPDVGFWATGEICRELNERYGFEYNTQYTDLSNYDITVHENIFLGSVGKKVGLWYTSEGAEDFSVITPEFKTDFTSRRPHKNVEQTGSFEDVLLNMKHVAHVDYFNMNPYATYSGGDYRLQILSNNRNVEGKKILIVRDSFANVVTPFLALHAGELHVADTRFMIPDEPLNIYDYIEQFKPDYVMLLYGGVEDPPHGYGRYDFDQTPS